MNELAKAEALIAELETELAGLRSRQTRDEDGAMTVAKATEQRTSDLRYDESHLESLARQSPQAEVQCACVAWSTSKSCYVARYRLDEDESYEACDCLCHDFGDLSDPQAVAPSTPQNEGSSQ